jgi:hypothetical protein
MTTCTSSNYSKIATYILANFHAINIIFYFAMEAQCLKGAIKVLIGKNLVCGLSF